MAGCRTVNTEMKRRVRENKKLKTTIKVLDFRLTNNACAIVLDKEQAVELAHQIIVASQLMRGPRLILTLKNSNKYRSISVVEY